MFLYQPVGIPPGPSADSPQQRVCHRPLVPHVPNREIEAQRSRERPGTKDRRQMWNSGPRREVPKAFSLRHTSSFQSGLASELECSTPRTHRQTKREYACSPTPQDLEELWMLVQHREGKEGVLVFSAPPLLQEPLSPCPGWPAHWSLTVPWPASGQVMKMTEGFQGLRAPSHLDRAAPSGWPGRLGPAHHCSQEGQFPATPDQVLLQYLLGQEPHG